MNYYLSSYLMRFADLQEIPPAGQYHLHTSVNITLKKGSQFAVEYFFLDSYSLDLYIYLLEKYSNQPSISKTLKETSFLLVERLRGRGKNHVYPHLSLRRISLSDTSFFPRILPDIPDNNNLVPDFDLLTVSKAF